MAGGDGAQSPGAGRDRLRDRLARRGLAPAVVFPALAKRPELVPAGLQTLAAQTMFFHVAGHPLGGKVSASVAALSERVIRAMNLRILSVVAAVALTIGAVGGTLPFLPTVLPHRVNAAQAEPPPGSLTGVVRDSEGKPVGGATVVAGAFTDKPNHQITTTGRTGVTHSKQRKAREGSTMSLPTKRGSPPPASFTTWARS